jgi:aryl-alcohol dehydrogenase-like predicted oxidoreductase
VIGMTDVPVVPLGGSGLRVSRMALGSWKTYERMSREDATAVMRAAREAGITFLDDARYDDDTGTAPMRTGYSEVVFGEVFKAAGWDRAEVVVANKLWWEFWPDETPGRELAGSLGRMSFDYIDLIYSAEPPDGVPLAEAVEMIGGLIQAGTARAWGTLFWPPALIEEASQIAERAGLPPPAACQPAYSLIRRDEGRTRG